MADTLEAHRRTALAEIFERVAGVMVDRVVVEQRVPAASSAWLMESRKRYGNRIKTTLPAALDTLREPVAAERDRKMGSLSPGCGASQATIGFLG